MHCDCGGRRGGDISIAFLKFQQAQGNQSANSGSQVSLRCTFIIFCRTHYIAWEYREREDRKMQQTQTHTHSRTHKHTHTFLQALHPVIHVCIIHCTLSSHTVCTLAHDHLMYIHSWNMAYKIHNSRAHVYVCVHAYTHSHTSKYWVSDT